MYNKKIRLKLVELYKANFKDQPFFTNKEAQKVIDDNYVSSGICVLYRKGLDKTLTYPNSNWDLPEFVDRVMRWNDGMVEANMLRAGKRIGRIKTYML